MKGDYTGSCFAWGFDGVSQSWKWSPEGEESLAFCNCYDPFLRGRELDGGDGAVTRLLQNWVVPLHG